jgi:hypothetical protein
MSILDKYARPVGGFFLGKPTLVRRIEELEKEVAALQSAVRIIWNSVAIQRSVIENSHHGHSLLKLETAQLTEEPQSVEDGDT